MAKEMATEVEKAVRRLSGKQSGEPGYIAKYQAGLKEVAKGLSADKIQEFKERAEEWKTKPAPPEAQAK